MVVFVLPSISPNRSGDCLKLDIPLKQIKQLCFSPVKWLLFVGWAIFNTKQGYLSFYSNGRSRIEANTTLVDTMTVYYQAVGFSIDAVVDPLFVIRGSASQTSLDAPGTSNFAKRVAARDGTCIFTGDKGQPCHIVPFSHGEKWLAKVTHQRGMKPNIQDIDDVRNGFLAEERIHTLFHDRQVAIMVTPNEILSCDDVPHTTAPGRGIDTRNNLPSEGKHARRYTLHCLAVDDEDTLHLELNLAPPGRDCKFKQKNVTELPSPDLLHYVYGVSVLSAFAKPDDLDAWINSKEWDRPMKGQMVFIPSRAIRNAFEYFKNSLNWIKTKVIPSSKRDRHLTPEEAMDFMFSITLRQAAAADRKELEERNLAVERWRKDCARSPTSSSSI